MNKNKKNIHGTKIIILIILNNIRNYIIGSTTTTTTAMTAVAPTVTTVTEITLVFLSQSRQDDQQCRMHDKPGNRMLMKTDATLLICVILHVLVFFHDSHQTTRGHFRTYEEGHMINTQ